MTNIMYKVVVVDDDIEILEYIEHLLNWEEVGFYVGGTAANGVQALSVIDKVRPDLLITDITMPGITGLELVRSAKQENKALKSIILTCHESFAFAKEALELGVQEYLVKYMLDRVQLESCVKKIRASLDGERQASLENQKKTRLLQLNAEDQVTQLLGELIQSKHPDDFLMKRRLNQNILPRLDEFHVVGFCIDDWLLAQEAAPISDMKLLHYSIINIINELMISDKEINEHVTKAYSCSEDMIVVFWTQPLKKDVKKIFLERKLSIIQEKISEILKLRVSCVISACYGNIIEFNAIYQCILKTRLCCYYPDDSRIVWNPRYMEEGTFQDKSSLSYELIDAIRTYESNTIMAQVRKEYSEFYHAHVSPEKMIRYFNNLVLFLESELKHQGMGLTLAPGRADTYEGCLGWTERVVARFLEAAGSEKKDVRRKEIANVISYMGIHLQEEITCESMAQMINMNVSYFSKIFKKETGESFSDYLMKIRIERATMLLQHSDLTMEEITSEIGLSNMHYFHRLYKKQTGKTPGIVRRIR